MGFRQALFLGGAVLVLAACSDATAPTSQMRQGGAVAAAKSDTTTVTKPSGGARTLTSGDCTDHGFLVSSGKDTTCVVEQ